MFSEIQIMLKKGPLPAEGGCVQQVLMPSPGKGTFAIYHRTGSIGPYPSFGELQEFIADLQLLNHEIQIVYA